jgi:ketosteroid isomerase-like protein
MSRENVELIRGGLEAWSAGDMAAFGQAHDRDVGHVPLEGMAGAGADRGTRRRDALGEPARSLGIDQVEPVSDFIDAGDRVIVRYRWHGLGHGPDMRMEFTTVCTIRNGKILVQEALEAIGLSE